MPDDSMDLRVIPHRGTHQIGGSCIEVASPNTRLILDCGWSLEGDGSSLPPPVPGLFAAGKAPDAVLLSHAHPDHTGFIEKIPDALPIYATEGTSKIMLVGSCYTPKAVNLPKDRFRELPIPLGSDACTRVSIGDLKITAYPVDHSAYGAVGLLIENGSKSVFYTGDLRFHGRKRGMARRIIRELAGKIDLLITEGTNLGRPATGLKSEQNVEAEAIAAAQASESLAMVAFSPQNLDRFVSFYRAAQRSGRTLVCDPYMGAVLYMLNLKSLPKPGQAANIRIFFPRRRRVIEKFEIHLRCASIGLEEIISQPERYMMLVRPSILEHDFGEFIPPQSVLLYGMWSGYRKDEKVIAAEARITARGGRIQECHASGHAHPDDLVAFIREVNSKRILPVHTSCAESFASFGFPCATAVDGEMVLV